MAYRHFMFPSMTSNDSYWNHYATVAPELIAMGWGYTGSYSSPPDGSESRFIFGTAGENPTHIMEYLATFGAYSYGCIMYQRPVYSRSGTTLTCYGTHCNSIDFGWDNSRDTRIAGNANMMARYINGYVMVAGHLKRFPHMPNATLVDTVSAGNSKVLAVNNTDYFKEKNWYQILGANSEGRDWVQVTGVVGNNLTVANIPRTYTAGSMIGASPSTFFVHGLYGTTYAPNWCNAIGLSSDASRSMYIVPFASTTPTDYRLNAAGLMPWYIYYNNELGGGKALMGYCDENFLLAHPSSVSNMCLLYVTSFDETGIVYTSTANTLTDIRKNWTPNQWVGKYVVITGGTGNNQTVRRILSNNASCLIIGASENASVSSLILDLTNTWSTLPNTTSSYRIVDEAYRRWGTVNGYAFMVLETGY